MNFLNHFDTFLLDLDGVVYVGSELLPGASEALSCLRSEGKSLRFLTNDPRPTREDVMKRLASHGVEVSISETITCGWATAAYLREQGIRSAYVVGSQGLVREIEEASIEIDDAGDVEAVVIGCDEHVGYAHIRRAALLVRKGAQFIATNNDATFPAPEGPAPATGAIVAAVQTACGQKPRIIGKPYPAMFKTAVQESDPSRTIMIGDSIESDILGARRIGITAVLIRSQVTRSIRDSDLEKADHIIDSLIQLC